MRTFALLIVTGLFLLLASSCKPIHAVSSEPVKSIPNSFAESKDSLSAASINWREYFKDTVLTSLIDTALKKNPDLLMTFQRIQMARANVRSSRGAMLPVVDAFGSIAQRRFGLYTMDGAGNATTPIVDEQLVPVHLPDYYVGLTASWELDAWGKLKNRKASALLRYLASMEGRNWMVTNLIAEISSTYYELLALDHQLDIVRETIVLQENAFNAVVTQKQAGVVNELVVQYFEAQLLNSKSLQLEVSQRIVEAESRLNLLMGRYPQAIDRDKSWFFNPVFVEPNVGLPSDLLKNRPDIKQAEYNLAASKADVKSARAAFYPSFNITGAYGFQAFKTTYLFTSPQSTAYTLLGSLALPLINRSAIKAEFEAAKASQMKALYDYQKSILNGYVEVYNELFNMRNLNEIFSYKNSEAALLTQSIETSSELFKAGRANYLEIILTQENALQAKLELIDIKRRQFNSTINLYKALGGGWQ